MDLKFATMDEDVLKIGFLFANLMEENDSNTINYKFNNSISTTQVLIQNQNINTHINLSGLELMEQNMGLRKQSLHFTILMSVTYIVIFLSGFIGNLSTCTFIITNTCMHTITNYYLFSLAVSDLLSLTLGRFYDFLLNSLDK
jgi:hypothetical protein